MDRLLSVVSVALYMDSHTDAVLLDGLPPVVDNVAGNQVGNSGQYLEGICKDHTPEIPEA